MSSVNGAVLHKTNLLADVFLQANNAAGVFAASVVAVERMDVILSIDTVVAAALF